MDITFVEVAPDVWVNPRSIVAIASEGEGYTRLTFDRRPGYIVVDRPTHEVMKALEEMNRG